MNVQSRRSNIVVVGAGPAGIAAAVRAAQAGAEVTLLDDNAEAGGQIWRRQRGAAGAWSVWLERLASLPIHFIPCAQVIAADSTARTLRIEAKNSVSDFVYNRLILATGARELFLPFPGWTLPNVMGAGGLQALAKAGLTLEGKRLVVAGSGPLLLATASHFRRYGAKVLCIAEQGSWRSMLQFGCNMFRQYEKLAQAVQLRLSLGTTPYRTSCWVEAAEGTTRLKAVHLRRGERRWATECDYLATSYGLVPNLELGQLLGCQLQGDGVRRAIQVDQFQRTSVDSVYAAGECTGIGGVDKSLLEGEIAGFAAADAEVSARQLWPRRSLADNFASLLASTFTLRPEILSLAEPDTTICRCEDVPLEKLNGSSSWRAAKLHHRCGMGPCQGRICGPIVETLFGWAPASVRPPIFPSRIESLTNQGEQKTT